MAINFPNDPATTPGDGGTWVDGDGNTWTVEIVSGEAIWTMTEAADTGGGGGGGVTSVAGKTGVVDLGLKDLTDVDTTVSTQSYLTKILNPTVSTTGMFNPNSQSVYEYAGLRVRPDGVAQLVGGSGSAAGNRSCVLSKDAEIQFSAAPLSSGDDNYTVKIEVTDTAGDAMSYRAAPTLGADATDLVIPTMGQVRAAIASNGGTSVSLNDLTDVSYSTGDLIVTGLTDISFEGDGKISDGNSNELTFTSTGLTSTGNFDAPIVSTNEVQIKNGSNHISLNAPSLGANITFNLPAVDGAASSVLTSDGAGNLTFEPIPTVAAPASFYEIGYESTTAYKFTGPGLDGTELNPAIYVVRGQKYVFSNVLGAHPFQLQTVAGTGESPYTDGVTGDQPIDLGSFEWEVPMDAPSTLFYQCTAHTAMSGVIYVLDNSGSGGAGAVESVNSQTGVVSLGIQDMDDFDYKYSEEPAFSDLQRSGTWSNWMDAHADPPGYEFPDSAGEWRAFKNTSNSKGTIQIASLDDDGNSSEDWVNVNVTDLLMLLTVDGQTYGPIPVTEISDSAAFGVYIYWDINDFDPSLYSWGYEADNLGQAPTSPRPIKPFTIKLGYTFSAAPKIPLTEGDILQWNDANLKFQPTALATVATSGDYNDLINAPSAGDAPVTSVNTETGDVSLGIQDMDDYALKAESGNYVWDGVRETSNTTNGEFGSERYKGYSNSAWQWYHFYVGKEDKNGSTVVGDWIASNLAEYNSFTTFILKVPGLNIDTEISASLSSTYLGNYLIRASRNVGVNPDEADWLGLSGTYPFDGYEVEFYPKELGSFVAIADDDVLQWNSARSKFEPTALDYSQINNTPAAPARKTVSVTTAALAIGATETGEIAATGASGLLISAQTDVAAWIRLYTSSATSTQDAGRNKDTDPVPGSGVLFEALYTTFTEKPITPGTTYFNLAGDSKLYYRITNESGITDTPITVTFKILPME